MKAIQIVKPNQLEVIEMEKPVLSKADNVMVRMTAAGICALPKITPAFMQN